MSAQPCWDPLSSVKGLLLPRLPLSDVHDLLLSCHLMPRNTTTDHASIFLALSEAKKCIFHVHTLFCRIVSLPCTTSVGVPVPGCPCAELLSHFQPSCCLLLSPLRPFAPSFLSCAPGVEGTDIVWFSRAMTVELFPVLASICSLPLIKNIPTAWGCFLNS